MPSRRESGFAPVQRARCHDKLEIIRHCRNAINANSSTCSIGPTLPQISVPDDPEKGDPLKVDLAIVARDLKLPPEKIEKTVDLLDQGNTIPFITRFRKDLTGGLNEQQILAIKQRVAQLRALAERKTFVLKSIESQGKLTDELRTQINKSSTSRRLEDLYLPFKPKKQSRASLARQQGLEPLADDIFSGTSPDIDLATRSTEFVRVDKGLTSVDDVIKGVGDLLAERFSENDELRSSLRKIMWNDGKLESQLIVTEDSDEQASSPEPPSKNQAADSSQSSETKEKSDTKISQSAKLPAANQPTDSGANPLVEQKQVVAEPIPTPQAVEASQPNADEAATHEQPKSETDASKGDAESPVAATVVDVAAETSQASAEVPAPESPTSNVVPSTAASGEAQTPTSDSPSSSTADSQNNSGVETDNPGQDQPTNAPSPTTALEGTAEPIKSPVSETAAESPATETSPDASGGTAATASKETTGDSGAASTESTAPTETTAAGDAASAVDAPAIPEPTASAAKPKKKKKKKKKKKVEDPFNDYRDFKQPLKQIPNHRILAINRGERGGKAQGQNQGCWRQANRNRICRFDPTGSSFSRVPAEMCQ